MRSCLAFMTIISLCLRLYAQPTTITWQGKLLDNSGNAITQTNVAMTFAMFDAATGGNQLWPASGVVTKTVDVVNGLYSLQLGTGTGDDIAFTAAMFDDLTPWLEVKVGTETLPRTEITNVPFALISNDLSTSGWEKPGEIGKTNPNTGNFTLLETENVKITTGAGEGKVLTSDADGNASWVTVTVTEVDPLFSESPAAQVTETDITNLSNLSGINTGDQDLSNLATKTALGDSVEQLRSEIPDVSGFITSETDPVFLNSVASGITQSDTSRWNDKLWKKYGNDIIYPDGKVGIGTNLPERNIHVNGSMRMDPVTEPFNPSAGDVYFDSGIHKLRYHNGAGWQDLSTPPTLPPMWSYSNGDFFSNGWDVICNSSLAVGYDVAPGESFGFATIILKENNLRIKFDDTSDSPSFPANDWQLTANESISGGENYFAIEDLTASNVPFKVIAGAPDNSIFVDSYGRLGLKTGTPVTEIHMNDGDTPTVRFQQNNSSGYTAQTWDVAGNEANFFIRDVTAGSTLPFRIQPGAPSNSITIKESGNVGIGTWTPQQKIHIMGIIRLEPVDEPATAGKGDIYYDKNTNKLRCYDGTTWHDLW